MPFEIVRNDIVNMQVDAVVNTANPNPVIGSGVDSGIHKKAGHELLAARQKIGCIEFGDAVITPGFGLDAKYVIHTVGPIWEDGNHGEEQILSSCYRKSLALAKEHECESIAFPLIATGNYGFPKPLALQIAVREISTFLLENEMQIYLVVFGKEAFALSEKLFKSVSSYIDENYIRSKTLDEYGTESVYGSRLETRRIRERLKRSNRIHEDICPSQALEECLDMSVGAAIPMDSDDWGQLLKDLDAGFSETLLQLIDRTGKKDSEIYKKANVDRKLFWRISKMTELVFILDRSGSMSGLEKDTIGGFNSMLEKQRKEPGDAVVSTVLFDNDTEVIHDRVVIADIPNLTDKEYFVRGCTALLDAVGGAIHHIGNVHKYARKEDVPEKTLFIITTDGMENASHRYTYNKVRYMIERQKEPEAITAFLEGDSFEDVIRTAVSLGGDCDTLTAIAGSIAEGFYGVPAELKEECYKRLPEPLLKVLETFEEYLDQNVAMK